MNDLATILILLSIIAIPVFIALTLVNLIKKKSIKKTLFGILGSVVAVILFSILQVATTPEEVKKEWAAEDKSAKKSNVKEEKVTTEKETTEKATTEKPATEVDTTEEVTTEKSTTETPAIPAADNNNVYGKLTDKDAKDAGGIYINTEKDLTYTGDKNEIFQIEKQFESSLGLNVDIDSEFLMEHAHDFMQEDATQVQKISDNEFIFESQSIGKKYNVIFSRPDGKTVTRVIVSQYE